MSGHAPPYRRGAQEREQVFWTLHIGTRKTGSKAVQRFLRARFEAEPAALCYPEPGRGAALWHQPIHTALCAGDAGPLARAVRVADPARHARAVLSCELFHTLPRPAVEVLRGHLGPARIVIFLRRQDTAINSLLNQYAKAHRVGHDQVLAFRTAALSPLPEFDYAGILDRWEAVFGPGSVVPVIYDKTINAVTAFCAVTGLAPPPDPVVDQGGEAVAANPNPALTRAGYAAFLEAKRAIRDPADLPAAVEALHRRRGDAFVDTRHREPPWLFDAGERASMMAQYAAGNERVRARWFPARSVLFADG